MLIVLFAYDIEAGGDFEQLALSLDGHELRGEVFREFVQYSARVLICLRVMSEFGESLNYTH